MSGFTRSFKMGAKNRTGKKFIYLLTGILLSIVMMLGVAVLSPTNNQIKGVGVDEVFEQGSNKFTLASLKDFNHRTVYQIGLYVNDNQIDPLNPLVSEITTGNRGTGDKLPSSIKKVREDFYIVTIKKVPEKQKTLSLKVGASDEMKAGFSNLNAQQLSLENSQEKGSFNAQSTADLDQEYYHYMIHFYDVKIEKSNKKLAKIRKNIATLNSTIKNQKEDLDAQVGKQKEDTSAKLKQTTASLKLQKENISKLKKSISSAKKSRSEYKKMLEN